MAAAYSRAANATTPISKRSNYGAVIQVSASVGFGLSPNLFLSLAVERQPAGQSLATLRLLQDCGHALQCADLIELQPFLLHGLEKLADNDAPKSKMRRV